MKNFYSTFPFLILFLFASKISYAQIDCGNNAGFELGTTAGWICKSGTYGTGPCPYIIPGVCPRFNTVVTAGPCINNNGIDAALNTGVDRHTIMDNTAFGTGIDPNSTVPPIHIVPPGAGNYTFRLGDALGGGIQSNPNYAKAEAIRFTLNVTAQNSMFNYRYSAFLAEGAHLPEEEPRFEVLVMQADSNDQLIPGGYLSIVTGISNPYCHGTSTFHHGIGTWYYSDWTDVSVNLSGYLGQNMAIEFRTSDCFPQPPVTPTTTINGSCTTVCTNGRCCTSGSGCSVDTCIGIPTCSNTAGQHSAYAYIDAYCSPYNGIKEVADNIAIRIYPNPMTSSSTIEVSGKKETEIVIFDMLGKALLRKELINGKATINKGDLEEGIYFVRVNNLVQKLLVN